MFSSMSFCALIERSDRTVSSKSLISYLTSSGLISVAYAFAVSGGRLETNLTFSSLPNSLFNMA